MQWKKEDNDKLFRTRVSKQEQKKAEKLLSLYFRLPTMIEAGRVKLGTAMTPTYEVREGASYLPPSSKVLDEVMKREQLALNEQAYDKLDALYKGLPYHLRLLWFVRYEPKNMHNCESAMRQLHMSNRNTYFKQKFELIGYIMDAFDLWE